jgi:hypothetical protein
MKYLRRFWMREVAILVGMTVITVVLTAPLSLHPATMVPEPSDPLLSAWRMHWVKHAVLSGPERLARLFDANIFHPYPLTLAFSEHFLAETLLALPILAAARSHLMGLSVSALLSFVLTAYAFYLLITEWTGCRRAGLIAGFLLAFSPFRFGHIHHLELLVTQWMPLTLLALHWRLRYRPHHEPDAASRARRRAVSVVLLVLFFNLQALSSVYYSVYLVIACGLMCLIYALAGWIQWRGALLVDAAIFGGVTLAVNWPIWQVYFRFSELMGAVRTPGEVRIYSAALADYFTTIPHNLLYGWTFGHWQFEGHQYQPLMPVGLAGLGLAIAGILTLARRPHGHFSVRWLGVFLIASTVVGFVLSLGTNDEALGPALSPVLSRVLPYQWLYDHIPGFTGLRVPARSGVLVVLGLAGLAGAGAASIAQLRARVARLPASTVILAAVSAVAVVEYWSVPLSGPELPNSGGPSALHEWLREATPSDAVILELPQRGASEFLYQYASTFHWRRLLNGGSGYTPPAHREMRDWFKTFPDWRSVDAAQQLGVNYIILHEAQYSVEEWQAILAQLPGYLAAFEEIHQVGSDVVLRVARPDCRTSAPSVNAGLSLSGDDQEVTAVVVLHNNAPAAFVADVSNTPSALLLGERALASFFEPLITPPGETRTLKVSLGQALPADGRLLARLTTLNTTIPVGQPSLPSSDVPPLTMVPLEITFSDGPKMEGYGLPQDLTDTSSISGLRACSTLAMVLRWKTGVVGDTVVVQLVDRFGRTVMESRTHPWADTADTIMDQHTLPLPGTLPPGAYGLRVRIVSSAGKERLVSTDGGNLVSVDQLPILPVIIRPGVSSQFVSAEPLAIMGAGVELMQARVPEAALAAGEWVRLGLIWRAKDRIERDLTVFTQLIGPDGRVWGQQDNPPVGGWYPTSMWHPGEVVQDEYALHIDLQAPAGTYQLVIGMYDSQTGQRVTVTRPDGTVSDHLVLREYWLTDEQ